MAKSKSHEVTIRVRFDAPLTAKQARYAVWNNVTDLEIYGTGKPGKDDWAMPGSNGALRRRQDHRSALTTP